MAFIGNALSSVGKAIGGILTGGASTGTSSAAGLADPFASQRPQYQGMLSSLMSNPSSVTQLPGYQFEFDQGMQALMRSDAASGNFGGGKMSTDAISFGQGLASTSFNNWESILANLSGVNAGNPAAAGQLAAGGAQIGGGAVSGLLGSIGSLFGGGSSGGGSSGGGLFGSIGNLFGGGNVGGGTGAGVLDAQNAISDAADLAEFLP